MYLMITSRCNMSCGHCGYSCSRHGVDMDIETFRAACQIAENRGDHIAIGGGEPTLHKQFWEILGIALSFADIDSGGVWLATNGSQTEIAIRLANLAKKGVIGCALSQDIYHDEIDQRVIDAFQKPKNNYYSQSSRDLREIRNVTGKEIKQGRCKAGKIGCICPDIFVKPNGDIHLCGCKKSPKLGTVFEEYNIPDYTSDITCYRELKGT